MAPAGVPSQPAAPRRASPRGRLEAKAGVKSVYGSEPRTRSYTHPKYATIHKLAGALDTGPIKLVRGLQDQHPLLVEDALRAKTVDGFSRPP